MTKIENFDDLNEFIQITQPCKDSETILRVSDNKSGIILQTVVVKHPIVFIRGLQEFCKSVSLPVSDVSVYLVGFISDDSSLKEVNDIIEISPYVYFNKPKEDDNSSKDN